jgi:hypothetical protein
MQYVYPHRINIDIATRSRGTLEAARSAVLTCEFERERSNERILHSLTRVERVAEVEGAWSEVERVEGLMACNN